MSLYEISEYIIKFSMHNCKLHNCKYKFLDRMIFFMNHKYIQQWILLIIEKFVAWVDGSNINIVTCSLHNIRDFKFDYVH